MYLSYDPRRNIAYMRLREAAGVEVETVKVSDEVNIDLASDGSAYGIELLNANAQLRDGAQGTLVLELAGQRIEAPLPEMA
ncbi:MAG: DUF2283 domain-containing protein [Alphaproteobacteria bacterium]